MGLKFRLILSVLALVASNTLGDEGSSVSIQDLASKAVHDYFDENWEVAIDGFETSLVRYRMLKAIDTNCGMRCRSPNISKELNMDFDGLDDLRAYGDLLAQAKCAKICREEHPFTKSNIERPREDFIRDFEARLPYNYLQYAYFQMGRIKQACQAALTFLEGNPGDEQMAKNIEYYKGLEGVEDSFFTDLEGKPYIGHFKTGVELYEGKNYDAAIDSFESALADYFTVYEECKSSCYIEREPTVFLSLPQSISDRYIPALECTLKCDEKLRPPFGGYFVDDFVARTYSYLQFSYYQLDNWPLAVPAAASAAILDPDDEVTASNLKYYADHAEEHGLDLSIHLQPRAEAVKHSLEKKGTQEVLHLMKNSVDYEDEGEVADEDIADLKNALVREISRQVVMEIGERLHGDIG